MHKTRLILLVTILSSGLDLYSMKSWCIARALATTGQHNAFMDHYRKLIKNKLSAECKEHLKKESQKTKNTLLLDIIKTKGFYKDAIVDLLEAGADVNAFDEEHTTALHYLAKKTRQEPDIEGKFYAPIIELFSQHLVDFDARSNNGARPIDLLESGKYRALFSNPASNSQQLLKIIKKLEELDARITEMTQKLPSTKD